MINSKKKNEYNLINKQLNIEYILIVLVIIKMSFLIEF